MLNLELGLVKIVLRSKLLFSIYLWRIYPEVMSAMNASLMLSSQYWIEVTFDSYILFLEFQEIENAHQGSPLVCFRYKACRGTIAVK